VRGEIVVYRSRSCKISLVGTLNLYERRKWLRTARIRRGDKIWGRVPKDFCEVMFPKKEVLVHLRQRSYNKGKKEFGGK